MIVSYIMVSKVNAILELYDSTLALLKCGCLFIISDTILYLLEDSYFYSRIVMVERCVPINLNGNLALLFMIKASRNLTKGSFIQIL